MKELTLQSSKLCPSCSHSLERLIHKKTKCPHCSKFIFVRTEENKKVLLTEKQVIKLDSERRINDLIHIFGEEQNLKFNSMDEIWAYLNKRILDVIQSSNFETLPLIYLQMGVINEEEGDYKDCIINYAISSHYSAQNHYNRFLKYNDTPTDLKDYLSSFSSMDTSPVDSSIRNLNVSDDIRELISSIAINPYTDLDSKLRGIKILIDGQNIAQADLTNLLDFRIQPKQTPRLHNTANKGCALVLILPFLAFVFLTIHQ